MSHGSTKIDILGGNLPGGDVILEENIDLGLDAVLHLRKAEVSLDEGDEAESAPSKAASTLKIPC